MEGGETLLKNVAFFFHCLIVSCFIASGCSYSSTFYTTEDKNTDIPVRFAIFAVENSDTMKAEKGNINNVKLSKTPIITDRDLVMYEWKTHKIELNKDVNEMFAKHIGESFVIIANGTRIYTGAFWSRTSPAIVKFPVILADGTVLEINNGYPISARTGTYDPRNDSRIYNALIDTGKLIE